jgi:hypothetical protein
MFNPSAAALLEQAIERVGTTIQIQRKFGQPPSATTFTVIIPAIVQNAQPDGNAEAQAGLAASQMGAISQNDRLVILMATALQLARFPLPVQKGDVVILPLTGDTFSVTKIDPYKRDMAGAIELTISGVA